MNRRTLFVALFAVAVLAVGIWVDVAFEGRTDFLRDVLSTGVVLVFGAIAGDVALTLIERAERQPSALRVALTLAISIGAVFVGHLLLPMVALLVQIPRAGFGLFGTIALAMEFAARQAMGPSAAVGALLGLIISFAQKAAEYRFVKH